MKVVDMHCDTISEMYERRKKGWKGNLLENDLHVDLGKMEKGDYLLQNFALFTNLNTQKDPLAYGMKLVEVFYEESQKWKDVCFIDFGRGRGLYGRAGVFKRFLPAGSANDDAYLECAK